MKTKVCGKCKKEKLLDEFCKNRSRKSGLSSACKKCRNAASVQYRKNNRDKIYQYKKGYYSKAENDKSLRDYHKRPSVREKDKTNKKQQRIQFPERELARREAIKAQKSGRLNEPDNCECCAEEKPLEKHHNNYSKPLIVVWLCKSCHRFYHRGKTEIANNIRKKVVLMFTQRVILK